MSSGSYQANFPLFSGRKRSDNNPIEYKSGVAAVTQRPLRYVSRSEEGAVQASISFGSTLRASAISRNPLKLGQHLSSPRNILGSLSEGRQPLCFCIRQIRAVRVLQTAPQVYFNPPPCLFRPFSTIAPFRDPPIAQTLSRPPLPGCAEARQRGQPPLPPAVRPVRPSSAPDRARLVLHKPICACNVFVTTRCTKTSPAEHFKQYSAPAPAVQPARSRALIVASSHLSSLGAASERAMLRGCVLTDARCTRCPPTGFSLLGATRHVVRNVSAIRRPSARNPSAIYAPRGTHILAPLSFTIPSARAVSARFMQSSQRPTALCIHLRARIVPYLVRAMSPPFSQHFAHAAASASAAAADCPRLTHPHTRGCKVAANQSSSSPTVAAHPSWTYAIC